MSAVRHKPEVGNPRWRLDGLPRFVNSASEFYFAIFLKVHPDVNAGNFHIELQVLMSASRGPYNQCQSTANVINFSIKHAH